MPLKRCSLLSRERQGDGHIAVRGYRSVRVYNLSINRITHNLITIVLCKEFCRCQICILSISSMILSISLKLISS